MKRSLKVLSLTLALSLILLSSCGNKEEETEGKIPESEDTAVSEEVIEESSEETELPPAPIEETPEPAPAPAPNPEPAPAPAPKPALTGMRPEFKKAMDEYEAFFNEYCDFMEEYETSDDILGMLDDYTRFMTQLVDMSEAMDALGEEEMSNEELKYYIEVTGRIQKRMASLL